MQQYPYDTQQQTAGGGCSGSSVSYEQAQAQKAPAVEYSRQTYNNQPQYQQHQQNYQPQYQQAQQTYQPQYQQQAHQTSQPQYQQVQQSSAQQPGQKVSVQVPCEAPVSVPVAVTPAPTLHPLQCPGALPFAFATGAQDGVSVPGIVFNGQVITSPAQIAYLGQGPIPPNTWTLTSTGPRVGATMGAMQVRPLLSHRENYVGVF